MTSTIACADYRGHQSHHRRQGQGWCCDLCARCAVCGLISDAKDLMAVRGLPGFPPWISVCQEPCWRVALERAKWSEVVGQ